MINTLQKSLNIAFMAASIFISGLSVDLAGAQNTAVGPVVSRRPADPLLSKYLRFRHLDEEQGLSSSTAWDVMKDRRGYLWVATFDGLNRYDGYNMTVYKHDPENSESISSNFIKCVFQDHTDTIWVGTANGFNKFDPTTEKFVRYTFEPSVSDQMVDEIYEDARGRLWIGYLQLEGNRGRTSEYKFIYHLLHNIRYLYHAKHG